MNSSQDEMSERADKFDRAVNDWMKRNNVGLNQYAQLAKIFIESNIYDNRQSQAALLRELLEQRTLFAIGSTSGVPTSVIEAKLKELESKV